MLGSDNIFFSDLIKFQDCFLRIIKKKKKKNPAVEKAFEVIW
jgi:hypothetical protein